MSSIVRGGVKDSFGKLLIGAVAALAIGAAGCMSSTTAHDVHAKNATGSSSLASVDSSGADDNEARADWRTSGAGQAAADRSTRQAERTEGPASGPDPLPWSPSARSTPSNGSAGTTNQRILRITPPSNNQR